MDDLQKQIIAWTAWLRDEENFVAARLGYLLRNREINSRKVICVKIFPDTEHPTCGAIIAPSGKVYQFVFNRAGMVPEKAQIEEWINITETYMQHQWRDEVMTGLGMVSRMKTN